MGADNLQLEVAMKFKLTKTLVAELVPGPNGARKEYYDSELDHFGIRVSKTGKKYFIMKRMGRKRIRVTIGNATVISPEEARRKAKMAIGLVETGVNPNDGKKAARIASDTLEAVFSTYLANRKLKPNTERTYRNLFDNYLSDWLKKPFIDITKEAVSKRHKEIAAGQFRKKCGNPEQPETSADNCMRVLRAVLEYTMDDNEELMPVNPVSRLSRRKEWFGAKRKRGVLTPEQLPVWYQTVMELPNPTHRDFFLFNLFTGLRKDAESAILLWEDVNLEQNWFVAPDTKNETPLYLPLSDYLQELLTNRKKVFAGEYVFPGTRSPHLVNVQRSLKLIKDKTGIKFSCHDLRRTFATIAESLDLSKYTIKALLNHKTEDSADVTAGYIIINVDRLRDPMQRITDRILKYINARP